MTVCNMSIEAGAKAGLVAPDDTTFAYLEGRPHAPTGAAWEQALDDWRTLTTDDGAAWDREVTLDATTLRPHVTWGTNPGQVTTIDGAVPSPDDYADATARDGVARALEYMGISAGQAIRDIAVDTVFIGSCTNSRIEDLRAAAAVLDGRHVTAKRVIVVPGSHAVKAQAEAEGLDRDLHRRRRRLARAGLLDVPGDEPRQAEPRRALGEHEQPQLRGSPGPRRAHPPRLPGGRRGHRRRRPLRHPGGSVVNPVRVITGTALPLRRADVDTDQIIPAEWLKRIERTGYEKGLFATWRDDRDFVLNDERFSGASILVAGPAFGVGSSREHAVWALQQYGFDAVIAPSFSDIFRNNCTKNGLVPVVLPIDVVEQIVGRDRGRPGHDDRRRRRAARSSRCPASGSTSAFDLDPSTQHRFLEGLDDIGITLGHEATITAYEDLARRLARPSPQRLGKIRVNRPSGDESVSAFDRELPQNYETQAPSRITVRSASSSLSRHACIRRGARTRYTYSASSSRGSQCVFAA